MGQISQRFRHQHETETYGGSWSGPLLGSILKTTTRTDDEEEDGDDGEYAAAADDDYLNAQYSNNLFLFKLFLYSLFFFCYSTSLYFI